MKEFKLDNSKKIVDFDELKRIDSLKTKVLKYALYKKRTENEIREKFSEEDEDLLEDVIENLKESIEFASKHVGMKDYKTVLQEELQKRWKCKNRICFVRREWTCT